MSADQSLDFEIHVGFSKRAMGQFERLAKIDGHLWKLLNVAEIVNGPLSMGVFEAHDVPGVLALMATKRATNLRTALCEVDRVAQLYADESDVRIELEQVVMTLSGETKSVSRPSDWVVDAAAFPNGLLIPETPPFEAHFSVKPGTPFARLEHSTEQLVDAAASAGVAVHQAVRFTNEEQVILTTFFESYEEMIQSTPVMAESYRDALARLNGLRLKVVAERIIACIQPRNASTPAQMTQETT